MAKVELTDRYVAAVKAPVGKRLDVFDTHRLGVGLILRVTPAGSKTWVFRYRTLDGLQRRLVLGHFPDMSLPKARDAAAEVRVAVRKRDGADPAGEKKRKRAETKAEPIKTMADLKAAYFTACSTGEWLPRGKRKRASTLAQEEGLWRRYIEPVLGDARIEDVTTAAIRDVLRGIAAKGHGVTSNRVRAQIRQMMNFAIDVGRIPSNPVKPIRALGVESSRERVLRDEEIKALWKTLDDTSNLRKPPKPDQKVGDKAYMSKAVALAVKLLLVTGQRRNEIAGLCRSELDLDQRVWLIPGARTKNGRPHLVPLTDAAAALIEEAFSIADQAAKDRDDAEDSDATSEHAFPSPHNPDKPITPSSITHAFRDLRATLGGDDITPHDLRRTVATVMASERLGVSPFVIGRILNHTSETGGAAAVTVRTYAVHDYTQEKRRALDAWASLLQEITSDKKRPANVTDIREAVR